MGVEARQERRSQFIDAARRCIATKGYRSLTVDDVCREAGLSKGSFYIHFETKQALLVALLDEDARVTNQLLVELGASHTPETERTRAFVRAILSRADDPSEVQARADLWAEMLGDPLIRSRFADAVKQRRAVLAQWLDAGIQSGEILDVPTNALASIFVALADGLMLHAALDPSGFRWANVRRALDVIIDGLKS